jgi:hypothetical protein
MYIRSAEPVDLNSYENENVFRRFEDFDTGMSAAKMPQSNLQGGVYGIPCIERLKAQWLKLMALSPKGVCCSLVYSPVF